MEPPSFSLKRHHSHSHSLSSITPPSNGVVIGEALFRILCPAVKVGGVIGKGGAVIRHLREDTGAKIRIIDDLPPFSRCDERVILVVAENKNPNPNSSDEIEHSSSSLLSPVQVALLKVFERILKVDEERSEKNEEMRGEKIEEERRDVVCRLLVPGNQVGCILGRGGKIVEKIRQDSGAQVRILPRELVPACASPGDELIQMTGNFQAVKKALLSVSSCLQEHPRADMFQGANIVSQTDSFPHRGVHGIDHHSRSFATMSASENVGHNHRIIPEEDVVFRLLCQAKKIGSLIGKGGSIVRAIQNETGASIKIGDPVAFDSDERVVIVLARESMDLKRSPAQDAVIRVQSRIAEVGCEPGAAVIARLLVHSQQIGCLLGKGGLIITEMRRSTGASIRIFGREQGMNRNTQNDEVVQVIGNLPTVQDALFEITSRLRESLFPPNQYLPFERSPSPKMWQWHSQAVDYGNPSRSFDARAEPTSMVPTNSESGQMLIATSVEVVVPQILLTHVCGENKTNLDHITQFSGADIIVHDPKPGATEGRVVISGTPSQLHVAQSLVQAFILCGQSF